MPASIVIEAARLPNGKTAGRYVAGADGVWLEKRVEYALHHFHSGPGWACNEEQLERLRHLGGIGVRLRSRTTRQVWESRLLDWDRYARLIAWGHGRQQMLPDQYWVEVGG